MKHLIISLFCAIALLASCSQKPEKARETDRLPSIFPDYKGVTVPKTIAPMNFNLRTASPAFERLFVSLKGSKEGLLEVSGTYADFPEESWRSLLLANAGGSVSVTVWAKFQGEWLKYKPFKIYVSADDLGEWGVTYRRIAPGYEVYGKMGLYQRSLSSFEEEPIMENTQVPGACVNCHTAQATDPKNFVFHVRGQNGATVVSQNGNVDILKAQNDSIHGSLVYPYWLKSGKFIAFSTNQTRQAFHTAKEKLIEVFDHSSDVLIYSPEERSIIINAEVATKSHFETYPVFSPDGRTLYFCSADSMEIPQRIKDVRYNLCRIGFNPKTGRTQGKADTIFNARLMGRSVAFPRPSYDGKRLMFTLAKYGTFPIWHKEADLWLLDLATGKCAPCQELNSRDTESFHNWSLNSRWTVFSSRRGTELYTRLYIAHVDENGKCSKPFLLPQKNPWRYYDRLMQSYNVPDFTLTKVRFNAQRAGKRLLDERRTATKVK